MIATIRRIGFAGNWLEICSRDKIRLSEKSGVDAFQLIGSSYGYELRTMGRDVANVLAQPRTGSHQDEPR